MATTQKTWTSTTCNDASSATARRALLRHSSKSINPKRQLNQSMYVDTKCQLIGIDSGAISYTTNALALRVRKLGYLPLKMKQDFILDGEFYKDGKLLNLQEWKTTNAP